MKTRYLMAPMVLALTLTATPSQAALINFDDFDASAVPAVDSLNPYQGFTWQNWFGFTTPAGGFFANGIVSGPNAAFSGFQFFGGAPVPATISNGSPFSLASAYLGAGWLDGLSITVQGFLGATQVATQDLILGVSGAALTNFIGFGNVDQVVFLTSGVGTSDPLGCGNFNCGQFTVDNISFGPPVVARVPEPATLALLSLGFAALGINGVRRKRVV